MRRTGEIVVDVGDDHILAVVSPLSPPVAVMAARARSMRAEKFPAVAGTQPCRPHHRARSMTAWTASGSVNAGKIADALMARLYGVRPCQWNGATTNPLCGATNCANLRCATAKRGCGAALAPMDPSGACMAFGGKTRAAEAVQMGESQIQDALMVTSLCAEGAGWSPAGVGELAWEEGGSGDPGGAGRSGAGLCCGTRHRTAGRNVCDVPVGTGRADAPCG